MTHAHVCAPPSPALPRSPLLPAAAGRGADLSDAADPGDRDHQPGRPERHVRARAVGAAAGARPAGRGRKSRRRRHDPRRARLRGCGARRLHDLHHADRAVGLQPVHPEEPALRPDEEPRADHQFLLPHAGVRGEREAGRENVSTSSPPIPSQRPTRCPIWRRRRRWSTSWRTGRRRTAPTSCACRSRAAATPSPTCSPASTPIGFLGLGNFLSYIRAGQVTPILVDADKRVALDSGGHDPRRDGLRARPHPRVLRDAGAGRHPERDHRARPQGDTRHRQRAGVHETPLHRPRARAGAQHTGGIPRLPRVRPRAVAAHRQGIGAARSSQPPVVTTPSAGCRSARRDRRP